MVDFGVDFVLVGSTKDLWCLKEETEQAVCEEQNFSGQQEVEKTIFKCDSPIWFMYFLAE